MAVADVHLVSLLPTLEGLIVPSKLYGILAAGRPVIFIGDDDGEIGRVINVTDCGRRVSVGDARALRDVLRNLEVDPEALSHLGARARQLFTEKYTLRGAVNRWASLIDALS